MPFGSWKNNFAAMVAAGFVGISLITTIFGQVMFNTRTIKAAIEQQKFIMKQNDDLLEQHHEMIIILRGLERRYLAGSTK